MRRKEKFNITINDIPIEAIVLASIHFEELSNGDTYIAYLAYAQNRLFTCFTTTSEEDIIDEETGEYVDTEYTTSEPAFIECICDYCVMPEFDKLLNVL